LVPEEAHGRGLVDSQQAGLMDYWIGGLLGWEAAAKCCTVAWLHCAAVTGATLTYPELRTFVVISGENGC